MFKTLDDLKKEQNQPKENRPGHFTGNHHSGQMIVDPKKKNQAIDDIVNQGKKQNEKLKEGEKEEVNIILYSNGFRINDGQLRAYDDPQNAQFMEDIKKQQVPREIRQQFPNGCNVGLDDRRPEAYRPPTPPKYVAFSGSGQNIGVVGSQALELNLQAGQIHIDQNKPKTQILLRLHNGETKTIEINTTDKVISLIDYVSIIAPVDGSFQLIAGFPPKPLTEYNQTIEEADLCNSKVTQNLV